MELGHFAFGIIARAFLVGACWEGVWAGKRRLFFYLSVASVLGTVYFYCT